jgi:hypothetical protein
MFVVRRQKSHRDENGMKEFIAKFGELEKVLDVSNTGDS